MCLKTTNEQDDCDECRKIFEQKQLVERPLFNGKQSAAIFTPDVNRHTLEYFFLQTFFLNQQPSLLDFCPLEMPKRITRQMVNNTDITEQLKVMQMCISTFSLFQLV